MAGPLNYTTKVAATRTVQECSSLLAEHGADAIATTYAERRPTGLRFQYAGQTFDLPVDVDAMQRVLTRAKPNGGMALSAFRGREHAERVAWRVVKDWLEAQMALVAAQQVPLDEVMLPYLITPAGRALREDYRDRLALESGDGRG